MGRRDAVRERDFRSNEDRRFDQPATDAKLESFALHTQAELDMILDRAVATQREWSSGPSPSAAS